MMATTTAPLTAEEYLRLPAGEMPTELVRGRLVEINWLGFRHGEICTRVVAALYDHLRDKTTGRVVINDAGVITARNPDTVRGPDVAYYSFSRMPRERSPSGYPDVPPELVFEVRSPTDRWSDLLGKVHEYLEARVLLVCLVDPDNRLAVVYHADRPERVYSEADVLELPEVLPGFAIRVGEFLS